MVSVNLSIKPRILLLIEPEKQRVLIAKMLTKGYEVCLAENQTTLELDWDLCIISPKALDKYGEQILFHKKTEKRSFMPILLMANHQNLTRINEEKKEYLDDVIVEPVKEIELHFRVKNLLRSRRLSLELKNRTEELSKSNKNWQQERKTRQQTEATLRESEAKLNTIVTHSTDGLLVVDRRGWIRFANPAAIALFHRPNLVGEELGVPIVGEQIAEITTFANNGAVTIGEMKLATAEWEGESVYIISVRDTTEHWHAEQALRNSEEQFRLLVEGVKDYALLLLDREGCISSWNVGAQNLLGYGSSEIIGKYFGCFYVTDGEDNSDLPWQNLQLAAQQGQFEADTLFLRQDGSEFWANCQISALYNEFGKRRGFVVAIRDISKARKAERERSMLIASLQESQERFRNLVETTSDLIWETNELLEWTYISPQIRNYLGYEPVEVLGKTRFEFMPIKEALRMRSFFECWLVQPQSFIKLENKHLHKDGRLVILETSAVPIFDEEGEFQGYRGIDRDISDRKRTEEQLRNSETMLARAEKIARLGSWKFDVATGIITWSDEVFHIFGIEPKEPVPSYTKLLQQIHPDDRRLFRNKMKQAISKGQSYEVNFRILHPNTSLQYLNAKGQVALSDRGQVVQLFGTVQDVTDWHLLQEKLRSSEAEMRGLLEAMTDVVLIINMNPLDIKLAPTNPGRFLEKNTEIVDKTIECFFAPEREEQFLRPIRQALALQEKINFEYSIPQEKKSESNRGKKSLPLGTKVWFSASISPLSETSVIWVARDITELKEAEWELSEERSRYRSVVEDQTELICRFLPDGTITFVNQAYCRYFKQLRHDLLGRKFKSLIPANEQKKENEKTNLLFTPEKPVLTQEYQVEIDGKISWLQWTKRGIFDPDGKAIEIQAIGRDITERVLAEKALRDREEQLELFFSQSLDGFFFMFLDRPVRWNDTVDKEEVLDYVFSHQVITKVNDAMLTQYGATSEQFVGLTPNELFAHDIAQGKEVWRRLFDGGRLAIETDRRKLDGTQVWIEGDYICMYDSSNRIIGHFGVERDISDRKRAEEEIREMSATLQNAVEGISRLDTRGRYISVNKAYASIAGYEVEETIGMKWQEIIHPSDRGKMMAMYQKMLETGKEEGEAMGIRKDGSIFYQQVVIIKAYDRHKNFIGHYRFMKDITERKRAELELQQAKEAAEVANRAKSEFLANMSHELRTPLNGILGYTQILRKMPSLSQEQNESLAIIQNCGEHLLTLINDILDLSKIEAQRMELSLTEFELPGFIKSIADIFQLRAQQKNILFNYERVSPLPQCVRADEKRLRQILINLLSNAVKFTDKGKVTLKVGTVMDSGDWVSNGDVLSAEQISDITLLSQGKIRFQVEDTGIGIEEKELTQIFLPFHQVDTSLHAVEGTGLGLSITGKLVKLMGGEIHVKSIPGQGSVFWADLELAEIACPNKCFLAGESESQIVGYKGKKRKVLVVDDQSVNRKILAHLLVPLGFEFAEAADGRDCLQKAAEFQPDLILMDLVMPVMDGFEATRRLRDLPQLQEVVVVALSASVFDATQQESLGAGCNSFIPKPIQVKQLLERLRLHLGLEWIYDRNPGQQPATEKIFSAMGNSGLISPSVEEITALFQLAMSGDIGGIIEASANLENLDSKYGPFAAQLNQMAKGFQIKQIRDFLKGYMAD